MLRLSNVQMHKAIDMRRGSSEGDGILCCCYAKFDSNQKMATYCGDAPSLCRTSLAVVRALRAYTARWRALACTRSWSACRSIAA